MNPAHEALGVVSEMHDNIVKGGITHAREEIGTTFADRVRGIVIASRGLDGNGVQRPRGFDMDIGWCGSCGAYHKLEARATEVPT